MDTSTTKPDARIKHDVLTEMKWDARVDETDVGVQVHNGVVTLTGEVSAYVKKLAALDAAHRVFGVLDVVDRLEVKPPTQWARTDEDLARSVRDALRLDVLVPENRISTTVSTGIVTLDGRVDSWVHRSDAERAVRRLAGVLGVVNHIKVVGHDVNPTLIKNEIEDALERQAEREARRLGVDVRDGVVTLTGTVRSWAERNVIERVAGFAPGVRRVEDQTIVDPYS